MILAIGSLEFKTPDPISYQRPTDRDFPDAKGHACGYGAAKCGLGMREESKWCTYVALGVGREGSAVCSQLPEREPR